MPDHPDPLTHVRLMTRMARTTGSDLDVLNDAQWSAALKRCCGCAQPGACSSWLAQHSQGADQAPDYCANAALMSGPAV